MTAGGSLSTRFKIASHANLYQSKQGAFSRAYSGIAPYCVHMYAPTWILNFPILFMHLLKYTYSSFSFSSELFGSIYFFRKFNPFLFEAILFSSWRMCNFFILCITDKTPGFREPLILNFCFVLNQDCQMVYFQTKNPNSGKFWRKMLAYHVTTWSILRPFGIFNGHLEFLVIWYIYRKIWQPCI
jgi:hypothetical protein